MILRTNVSYDFISQGLEQIDFDWNIYSKDPADRILKMIWSRDRMWISHAGGESRDRIWNIEI